jgi:hypothetical protein
MADAIAYLCRVARQEGLDGVVRDLMLLLEKLDGIAEEKSQERDGRKN